MGSWAGKMGGWDHRNNFLIGGARNFSESSHPQINLLINTY